MKKISDAVSEIITPHSLFHFGLHHRLLNLSQVARFIKPLVEARTHKEVHEAAVLMSLSRLQAKLLDPGALGDLVLSNINIHSGLCSLTVFKTPEVHQQLNRVFSRAFTTTAVSRFTTSPPCATRRRRLVPVPMA